MRENRAGCIYNVCETFVYGETKRFIINPWFHFPVGTMIHYLCAFKWISYVTRMMTIVKLLFTGRECVFANR